MTSSRWQEYRQSFGNILGEEEPEDELEMVARTERLAMQGDAVAQYQMGQIAAGLCEESEQRDWLRKAAQQGYLPAMYELAESLTNFMLMADDEDIKEARHWNAKAVEGGYRPAVRALALSYETGEGYVDQQNVLMALNILSSMAFEGCKHSAYELARIGLDIGETAGMRRRALFWLKRAALADVKEAQALLSRVYAGGYEGIPQDVELAHFWADRVEAAPQSTWEAIWPIQQ